VRHTPDDLLRSGDYARKQIYCPSGLVRWSHGSRFEVARALVAPRAGGRLLDYGCGDGTFVAMVHDGFTETVGVDVDPKQTDEAAARLGHLPGVRFGSTSAPCPGPQPLAPFDVVTCMEVLEHCLEDERRRVIGELARLAAPSGLVVVSVPIEIGPSLAAKQFARAMAGLRGLGDYRHRERYSPLEVARSVFGLRIPRAVLDGDGPAGPYRYHGHKGFDYRDVGRELSRHFTITRRLYSPMRALGPVLNSQAWFVCSAGQRSSAAGRTAALAGRRADSPAASASRSPA
jgi:SAM-dependent methyltransferase